MGQSHVESAATHLPLDRQDGTARLRDLVVFLEGPAGNGDTLEFAAALAEEHGAHLTGVYVEPDPAVRPSETFARGRAIHDVIVSHGAMRRAIETERQRLFERVAAAHGIQTEWRVIPRFTIRDTAAHARYGDLALVARRDRGDPRGGHSDLVGSLVLTSGRPTIVLPPRCATVQVRRVLVGWNAEREAARAVADALPLLARAEAVVVLVVDEGTGAGVHGQEPGADIARYLARHGANVDVRRLPSGGEDVGRLLLARAEAFRADLVVMGAYGHSRLAEWVFGGVTRTVLAEAQLPVLMSR